MKIHLIKKQTIEQYVKNNVQSRTAFSAWLSIIKWVEWEDLKDVKSTFNSADILGKSSNRTIKQPSRFYLLFLISAGINIV